MNWREMKMGGKKLSCKTIARIKTTPLATKTYFGKYVFSESLYTYTPQTCALDL